MNFNNAQQSPKFFGKTTSALCSVFLFLCFGNSRVHSIITFPFSIANSGRRDTLNTKNEINRRDSLFIVSLWCRVMHGMRGVDWRNWESVESLVNFKHLIQSSWSCKLTKFSTGIQCSAYTVNVAFFRRFTTTAAPSSTTFTCDWNRLWGKENLIKWIYS